MILTNYRKSIKILFFLFFLLYAIITISQQTPRYTQFTLNNLGYNPAYAGTHPAQVEFMSGTRLQWLGFKGAPRTSFFGVSYGHRGKYNYKGIHGFSIYFETDKAAGFKNDSYYLGYAYHLRLINGINIGFGIMTGGRSFSLNSNLYNINDPAFSSTMDIVRIYPDFITGFRMYSKRFFMDISMRQLYKNKIKQGSQQLGKNALLIPHYFFTYGRKIKLGYENFVFVPAVHIQSSLITIPQVDLNLLMYFNRNIGFGLNYRVGSNISGIMQINIFKNAIVGISYDYTANKFNTAAANTFEIMFGFSPLSAYDKYSRSLNADIYPSFDY